MRSMKWKCAIAALASVAVFGTAGLANAQAKSGPEFKLEKSDISKDLQDVKTTRTTVAQVKERYQNEKNLNINTNATKKELRKAKADYKWAKAYLRADKRDLLSDHKSYIAERRSEVSKDRMAVVAIGVKPTVAEGHKGLTAKKKAQQMASSKQELKEDKLALKQARINRNNDVLAINEKISDADAQNQALLGLQNANARVQNSLAME